MSRIELGTPSWTTCDVSGALLNVYPSSLDKALSLHRAGATISTPWPELDNFEM